MKRTVQNLLLAGIFLSMICPNTPLLAKEFEEASDQSDSGKQSIRHEVANVTNRHEGIPKFYQLEYDQSISQTNADPMYRLYNPNSGEHFYTKAAAEKDNLIKAGWSYEGIGWFAPQKNNAPVYRLYNPNAGDHHYTTSMTEKDYLVKAGWKDEGIGWYSADQKTGKPLYRSYNPNSAAGTHNYTLDSSESDYLIKAGWKDEGIGWYSMDLSAPSKELAKLLQEKLAAYQEEVLSGAEKSMLDGNLSQAGQELAITLKSLENKLPARRYALQDNTLVGAGNLGSETVYGEKIDFTQPVLVYTPDKRQLMRADEITERCLTGEAVAFSADSNPLYFTSAVGSMSNGGRFNGTAIRYERYDTGSLYQEELAQGLARNNVMDGTMRMETQNLRKPEKGLDHYTWTMDVANGKAKAEHQGNYYTVYSSDDLEVYYDFQPDNLKFWYE